MYLDNSATTAVSEEVLKKKWSLISENPMETVYFVLCWS